MDLTEYLIFLHKAFVIYDKECLRLSKAKWTQKKRLYSIQKWNNRFKEEILRVTDLIKLQDHE